jgi:hypothetical protein
MYNENILLNENSPSILQPKNINIILKNHQLTSIHKAYSIEKFNLVQYGIMNDKPGSGKTYTILGLIYHTQSKNNLIVVPQNLINQWTESIINFSDGLLHFKKILNYSDIMEFYDEDNRFFDNYHIYLTSSLYYHSLCTTFNSCFLQMNRIFFDEIDSISNILVDKMDANFIWFVSASFNFHKTGSYKIDSSLLDTISVKCENEFIKKSFDLQDYNEYKIICKNFYLDNIFKNVIGDDEITLLNALDYSNLKRKFHSKIANNELEAITYLIKDKKEIIEIEELRITDLEKSIEKTENSTKKNDLMKILDKSKNNLHDTQQKLDLIQKRLLENDCCPLCYEELKDKKKVISPCCQNNVCYDCAENWFANLQKTSCIYCNTENVKLEHYVLVKNEDEDLNKCTICDTIIEDINDQLYSNCCEKIGCQKCIKEWYFKLLKKECLFCHNKEILHDDFKNKTHHDEMTDNLKNGVKYINKSKLQFVEHFLMTKTHKNSKIIFCSQFPKIFNDLTKLLENYNIKFIELDNGNISDIDKNVFEYNYGNIHVLLLNSNLFGCGLNLQITTDILFLHKTEHELQTQIIGRAQRPGRKNKLCTWFLMHENEHYYQEKNLIEEHVVENNLNDYHINIIQNDHDDKITYL